MSARQRRFGSEKRERIGVPSPGRGAFAVGCTAGLCGLATRGITATRRGAIGADAVTATGFVTGAGTTTMREVVPGGSINTRRTAGGAGLTGWGFAGAANFGGGTRRGSGFAGGGFTGGGATTTRRGWSFGAGVAGTGVGATATRFGTLGRATGGGTGFTGGGTATTTRLTGVGAGTAATAGAGFFGAGVAATATRFAAPACCWRWEYTR